MFVLPHYLQGDSSSTVASVALVTELLKGLAVNEVSQQITNFSVREAALHDRLKNHDFHRVLGLAVVASLAEVITENEDKWLSKLIRKIKKQPSSRDAILKRALLIWTSEPDLDYTNRLTAAQIQASSTNDVVQIDHDEAVEMYQHLLETKETELASKAAKKLAKNLSRDFEVLLRTDSAAMNGFVIALLKIHGDKTDQLLTPQPIFKPREDSYSSNESSVRDLQFERRVSKFRHAANQVRTPSAETLMSYSALSTASPLSQLLSAINNPAKFRVILLTGDAGTGKSRLALEACLECEGFHSGYLERWPETFSVFRVPTVIVIDSVTSNRINGGCVDDWIQTNLHRFLNSEQPVRLVLIDRKKESFYNERLKLLKDFDRLDPHIYQMHLEANRPLFEVIFLDELKRMNVELADYRNVAKSLSEKFGPDAKPLYAMLAAQAVKEHPVDSRHWSLEAIFEGLYRHQVENWKRAGVSELDLDYLTVATMIGAYPTTEPVSALSAWSSRNRQDVLHALLDLSENKAIEISPIKPDLLGEWFVHLRLMNKLCVEDSMDHEERKKRIFEIIDGFPEEPLFEFFARYLSDIPVSHTDPLWLHLKPKVMQR